MGVVRSERIVAGVGVEVEVEVEEGVDCDGVPACCGWSKGGEGGNKMAKSGEPYGREQTMGR